MRKSLIPRSLLENSSKSWARCISTESSPLNDLVETTGDPKSKSVGDVKLFNPAQSAASRTEELPTSRYKFRSPRFYRGRLHPIQPPPKTDIHSREFVPGPFMRPRLQETYESTIASDILTVAYNHIPPGTPEKIHQDRLRPWTGDSPYLKNRPVRGPRGRKSLLPIHKSIDFTNIPCLKNIVIHSHMRNAISNSSYLQVGSLALQSISGVRASTHLSKQNVVDWGAKKDRWVSATVKLEGESMYNFLAKLVDLVLPRIKDWKGISGTSGDETGNISFGLTPDQVGLFPEIQVNLNHYPPQMIPGLHITLETTATTIREGRFLVMALGLPFYGNLRKS